VYKLTFFTTDENVALSLYRAGDATPGIHQAELFLLNGEHEDCQGPATLLRATNKQNGVQWPRAGEDEDM
jgi:hypothetical protein